MSCAILTQWPPQHSKPLPQVTCTEQAGAHTPEPQTLPAEHSRSLWQWSQSWLLHVPLLHELLLLQPGTHANWAVQY